VIFRALMGCVIALVFASVEAAAKERLPAWISIAPKLSSSTGKTKIITAPPSEDRAQWERDGHGYVDLLWRIEFHFERSGMIESRVEVVRHFLSESGISQGGNMDLYADAWRDRLTIETAYSVSAGDTPIFINPETIEVIPETGSNIFSDWNRVILPIPGLRPGSNAAIAGTRRFQSADFPLHWSSITALGSASPVARVEIEISADAGAPMIEWDTNDADLDCVENGDRGVLCTRLNIPAVQFDRDVMSYLDLVPQFFVGHAETWSDLQSAVRILVDNSAKTTPSLRAKVAELRIDPATPPEEKLRKLLRFVSNEIRYVSLSHGDATVVPHQASLTLSRRYGDCKDKVTLLVALAKLVDLEVIPVLTSSERKDRKTILKPSSSYFDHMIACIETEPEQRICVDPTQTFTSLELPPVLGGSIALALGWADPATLGNLPTVDFGWEVHLQRDRTLKPDGTVETRDIRRFSGPGSAGDRTQIFALSQADRITWAESVYREVHGTKTPPAFDFRIVKGEAVSYEIESKTASAGGYQPGDGEFFDFDLWLIYYARNMASVNRHHPYRLLGLRYTAEETVALCCGDIEFFGPTIDFESEFGSLRRSYRKMNGKLVMKTVFELPAAVISLEDVPRLRAFIIESTQESAFWFSWQPET
jgi:hypothetical protein